MDTGTRLKKGHCFQVGNFRIDLTECETEYKNQKPYTDYELEVEFVDQQALLDLKNEKDLRPIVRLMLLNAFILSNMFRIA